MTYIRTGILILASVVGCTTTSTPLGITDGLRNASHHSASAFSAEEPFLVSQLQYTQESSAVAEASDLLAAKSYTAALQTLTGLLSPAAALMRARVLAKLHRNEEAAVYLQSAKADPFLADAIATETMALALETSLSNATLATLRTMLLAPTEWTHHLVTPLLRVLPTQAPLFLLEHEKAMVHLLPDDPEAMGHWLRAKAESLRVLGRDAEANVVAIQHVIEVPLDPKGPDHTPDASTLSLQQRFERTGRLLAAHSNHRAIEYFEKLQHETLTPKQRCQLRFGLGRAHRKLHHYAAAEEDLTWVAAQCQDDEEMLRRAMYTLIKVISIREGLRALPTIDAFAKRFVGHSMVDDVLFWAGDIYQRRNRFKEAAVYYQRIVNMPAQDDQCADARWRLGWMAYKSQDYKTATRWLQEAFANNGCAQGIIEQTRARYWLGRIAEQSGATDHAVSQYLRLYDQSPLTFYGQLAMKRTAGIQGVTLSPLPTGSVRDEPKPCPGSLADHPDFTLGLHLLTQGLRIDARRIIEGIRVSGEQPPCANPQLVLALLLHAAGDQREAHWRLRKQFASTFTRKPSSESLPIWHAAYPLAFRSELAAAEAEFAMPHMLLQAIAREESAFDTQVVSWAGAYGLTQLLLSTGQFAGALLKPPLAVPNTQPLLNPKTNARLGGAFLMHLVQRYGNSIPLALVAYNSSQDYAQTLLQRHDGQPFDIFVEEIGIKETRRYVKRVLQTFGIYRWLYTDAPTGLQVGLTMPTKKVDGTKG